MAEVTIAVFEVVSACCARVGFVRDSHALIERSIRDDRSGLIQVEKLSVGNLYYRLPDNVIIGSGNTSLR